MRIAALLTRQQPARPARGTALHTVSLENIRVASPCPASWDVMTGDDRVRHCSECKLNVYNLSEMTRSEAEQLIAAREGRLCVRFYRRADGAILTRDCPLGLRAITERVSRIAGSILSAMMSVGFAAAQSPSPTQQPAAAENQQELAAIWVLVLDPNGATVQGAQITLFDEEHQKTISAVADSNGQTTFLGLPPGAYAVSVNARGFENNQQTVRVGTKRLTLTVHLQVSSTLNLGVCVNDAPIVPTIDVIMYPEITPIPIQPLPKQKKHR